MISECFEVGKNSLEQMSINFVNETLRQFSTDRLIREELKYYKSEGLETPQVGFLDNGPVLGRFFLLNPCSNQSVQCKLIFRASERNIIFT